MNRLSECKDCGGELIRGDLSGLERGTDYQLGETAKCSVCGSEWLEVYHLAGIEQIVMGEPQDDHAIMVFPRFGAAYRVVNNALEVAPINELGDWTEVTDWSGFLDADRDKVLNRINEVNGTSFTSLN